MIKKLTMNIAIFVALGSHLTANDVDTCIFEEEGFVNHSLTQIKKSVNSVDVYKIDKARMYFPISFDFDSYEIKSDQSGLLNYNIDQAQACRIKKLILVGYADKIGHKEYNFELGLKRAHQLSKILIERGVDPTIIEIKSGGDVFQSCDGNDELCLSSNRIVTIEEIVK